MKPSNSPEVAAIFDTVPEFEIVQKLLEDRHMPGTYGAAIAYCRHEYETSLVGRFLTQTRVEAEGNPFYIRDFGRRWQQDAQFEVLERDVPSIVHTAREVVEGSNWRQALNRASKARKAAAETILVHLER